MHICQDLRVNEPLRVVCVESDDHRHGHREHEHADHLVLAEPERVVRVAGPQITEREATDRVPRDPEPEDQAVRQTAPTKDERPHHRDRVPHEVVRDDEVDRIWREARVADRELRALAERRGIREFDAEPQGRGARGGVVLAVDDVADPSQREPERDPGRRGVCAGADGDRAPPDRDDEPTDHATDRGAPDRDAACPDLRDELRMREVPAGYASAAGPAVEHMEDARADDPADNAPGRDRVRVALVDAELAHELHREPHAEEDADRREDAVPRERQRPEMDVRIQIDGDHAGSLRSARCAAGDAASGILASESGGDPDTTTKLR